MKRFLMALFLLCGCSPNSSEEFQREGEASCRLLIADLQKIENREQLLLAAPLLKKRFEGLIDLMIEAREFQEKKEAESSEEMFSETSTDLVLENELRRIYTIEGGREVIERAQQEAAADHIFGVPIFVFESEPFWGHDRLPLLQQRLEEAGLRI